MRAPLRDRGDVTNLLRATSECVTFDNNRLAPCNNYMMSKLTSVGVSTVVVSILVLACSSGTTGGTSGTTDGGSSGTSGGNSDGGSISDGASSGEASPQGDCTTEAMPVAPTTCTVAGTYAITAEVKCPSCLGARGYPKATWTVTATDSKVKIDTTGFLMFCTLSGCTCTTQNGDDFSFTATGFTGLVDDSGDTATACSYKVLVKGVRK